MEVPNYVNCMLIVHKSCAVSLLTSLYCWFNPLNAKLNPICPLLALFGAHHILHVSS